MMSGPFLSDDDEISLLFTNRLRHVVCRVPAKVRSASNKQQVSAFNCSGSGSHGPEMGQLRREW